MMRVRRARHAAVVMAGLVAGAVIWLSLGLASSTSHNAPVHHWGVTGYLNSVACPSPTSCFAVGYQPERDDPDDGTSLEVELVGKAWRPVGASIQSKLWSKVECRGATCVQFGWHYASRASDPNFGQVCVRGMCGRPAEAPNGSLMPSCINGAASSPFPLACVAAGVVGGDLAIYRSAGFSSSWRRTVFPNIRATPQQEDCPSTTVCYVLAGEMGPQYVEDFQQVLIVVRGASARVELLPKAFRQWSFALSCISVRSCLLAGTTFADAVEDSVVLTWSGSTWRTSSVLHDVGLASISCGSPTNCVAVGFGPNYVTAFRRDGTGWKEMAVPSPSGPKGDLAQFNLVECSGEWCLAIGRSASGSPIAAQWHNAELVQAWEH